MSDYVHTADRPKTHGENRTIESRLMFGACYVLFLLRAVVARLMPWRKASGIRISPGIASRSSAEASSAAGAIGGVVVHGFVTGISSGGCRADKLPYRRRSGIRCRPRSGGERPQGHH